MKKKKSAYEELFELWLKKAKELKYVKSWRYEPETFLLFDKGEYAMRKITYTPDYVVEFTKEFFDDFPKVEKIIQKFKKANKIFFYQLNITAQNIQPKLMS